LSLISPQLSTIFFLENRVFFENYALQGGILEIHSATNSVWDHSIDLFPGGFNYTPSFVNDIRISIEGATILTTPNLISDSELDNWGGSAHGTISGLQDNDTIYLTAVETEEPVLIEKQFGNGSIVLTSQTLEFSYGNNLSPLIENIVLYKLHNFNKIGIFQSLRTENQDSVRNSGFFYDTLDINEIGLVDLSVYEKVIIPNDQNIALFNAVINNLDYFEIYVASGGILEIHAGSSVSTAVK